MGKLIKQIGFLVMVVLLFSGLGCKKQTATTTTTTTSATPTATYSGSKTTTPTTTAAATTTSKTATTATPTATSAKTTSATPLPFETTTPATTETTAPTTTSDATATTTPVTTTTEPTDDDTALKNKAEKLAEIFGTYTNKDKESHKNLADLKKYATIKMQSWLDSQIKIPMDANAPFYGVTTKALSSAITSSASAKKSVLATVKKEEILSTNQTPESVYALLMMNFVKESGEWKLDGAYWQ